MKKKLLLAVMAGLFVTSSQVFAEQALPNPKAFENNAGGQMNRLNDFLERERAARQIQEDREKKAAEVEGTQNSEETAPEVDEVMLQLNDLITDTSLVLSTEEIKAITKDYVGKQVSVNDLYRAVARINALYKVKGYMSCKAFLFQQTIENGVVKITLIEGKTGDIKLENNNWTKASYIKKRISLDQGEVANISQLNKDLLRFNATNDVQLRITMQAGTETGTTDYAITAYEPKQYTWNVLVDNAGNENNGKIREGVFFTARSISGNRDSLTVGNINSKGSKAVSTSYSRSIGRSGSKMTLGYNTNSVKTTKGAYKNQVYGHSNAISLSFTQPWIINAKTRSEAVLELNHQKSSTDFRIGGGAFRMVNDTYNDAFLGFAMTNYGNSHVFYQKHGFLMGRLKAGSDVRDESQSYFLFKTNGFYQKAYQHGQNISARAEGQWSTRDNVPSARQFYIGGINTIRGYEESFRGSDKGINMSFEYAVPLNDKRTISGFTFLDYGQLFGEDAESANSNNSLYSTGLGIKANVAKNIYANLTMGIPLKRNLADGHKKPSKARLHFTLSGQF